MTAKSIMDTMAVIMTVVTTTTVVDSLSCSLVGHETFFISAETLPTNDLIFSTIAFIQLF